MNQPTLRAILIGVDCYPEIGAHLLGSVSDVLEIRRFLLERAGVDRSQVQLRISPLPAAPSATSAPPADSVHVREAFLTATRQVGHGDQLLVYFAGHGVRIRNHSTGEEDCALALANATPAPGGTYANLMRLRELEGWMAVWRARGTDVTVVLDCCFGINETWESGIRSLPLVSLSPAVWEEHCADAQTVDLRASEQLLPLGECTELAQRVVLRSSADRSVTREYACRKHSLHAGAGVVGRGFIRRGLFSQSFVTALQKLTAPGLPLCAWRELVAEVEDQVRRRSAESECEFQRPQFEGNPRAWVLGGMVGPFTASGSLLPPGREVSVGRDSGIRSRTTATSVGEQRLSVSLKGLPGAVREAMLQVPRARELVELVGEETSPPIAVIPWAGPIPAWQDCDLPPWVGSQGGWAIVTHQKGSTAGSSNDVLAYVPAGQAESPADSTRAGAALGSALVHRARYENVLGFGCHGGALAEAATADILVGRVPSEGRVVRPDADGVYNVYEEQPLWVLVTSTSLAHRLRAGIALCSNDGNVAIAWPPDGAELVLGSHPVAVGQDRLTAARLQVRRDQSASLYVFKVMVQSRANVAVPSPLSTLAMPGCTQDHVVQAWQGRPPPALPAGYSPWAPPWFSWNLRVRVHRSPAEWASEAEERSVG